MKGKQREIMCHIISREIRLFYFAKRKKTGHIRPKTLEISVNEMICLFAYQLKFTYGMF